MPKKQPSIMQASLNLCTPSDLYSLPEIVAYYGQKTPDEIHAMMSNENWVMFPHKSVHSKKEGENAPYPNVYVFHLGLPLSTEFRVGLTFQNLKAMEFIFGLRDPLNSKIKVNIENQVRALPKEMGFEWKIEQRQNIKYKTDREWVAGGSISTFRIDPIIETLEQLKNIGHANRKKLTEDGIVTWEAPALNLAVTTVYSLEEAREAFKVLFPILVNIFDVKIGKDLTAAKREDALRNEKRKAIVMTLKKGGLTKERENKYRDMLKELGNGVGCNTVGCPSPDGPCPCPDKT